MRAPCLQPGGMIGLCSPSSVMQREIMEPRIAEMKALGFRVREAENLYSATYGYLPSPEERAADFNQLIRDPEVGLVLFGGGEGGNELLPLIDYEAIRQQPKRMASYSDGTTILNAVWAITGLETYYGASPRCFAGGMSDFDRWHFEHHLVLDDAKEHLASAPWRMATAGTAEGILVGGYTRNFAMLLGSRYFPCNLKEKHILFLEDHEMFGGVDYVSAMISHIEQSDFMETVTGLLFGHYSSKPQPELMERLRRLGRKWQIPVAYCDDFGHGDCHAILPIGRKALLDTEKCVLRYQ